MSTFFSQNMGMKGPAIEKLQRELEDEETEEANKKTARKESARQQFYSTAMKWASPNRGFGFRSP